MGWRTPFRRSQVRTFSFDSCAYVDRRLIKTPGKSQEDMHAVIAQRPPHLSCTENLGVMDFYPTTSGKESAAQHLMRKWGVAPAATAFLCDDDNDLALAAVVGKAFLPSISTASMTARQRSWGLYSLACVQGKLVNGVHASIF